MRTTSLFAALVGAKALRDAWKAEEKRCSGTGIYELLKYASAKGQTTPVPQ